MGHKVSLDYFWAVKGKDIPGVRVIMVYGNKRASSKHELQGYWSRIRKHSW